MNEENRSLLEQFVKIHVLISRYFHRNHRGHGQMSLLFNGQGRVLKLLKLRPEISQKELAKLVGIRPQSLGELLSKLEKKEFVTRQPSEKDKRVTIVKLTEKGENEVDSEDDMSCFKDDLFDCLSNEEKDNLSEYLNRIITSLPEKLDIEDSTLNHRHHRNHRGLFR